MTLAPLPASQSKGPFVPGFVPRVLSQFFFEGKTLEVRDG